MECETIFLVYYGPAGTAMLIHCPFIGYNRENNNLYEQGVLTKSLEPLVILNDNKD